MVELRQEVIEVYRARERADQTFRAAQREYREAFDLWCRRTDELNVTVAEAVAASKVVSREMEGVQA